MSPLSENALIRTPARRGECIPFPGRVSFSETSSSAGDARVGQMAVIAGGKTDPRSGLFVLESQFRVEDRMTVVRSPGHSRGGGRGGPQARVAPELFRIPSKP
jgi:hypothetical protein